MVLSWLRRTVSERQAIKAEDLPDEVSNALAWGDENLAEHELQQTATAGVDALASVAGAAPTDPETSETSDIKDTLLAVLHEAEALPDSAANRLASTVNAVAVNELVANVRGLRRRLSL